MKGSGQCRLCEKTKGDYVDKVKNPCFSGLFGVNKQWGKLSCTFLLVAFNILPKDFIDPH